MFPHYNKKSKNHEIPSQEEIKEREREQEVDKKAKPDFFRKQIQDKNIKEGEQNEEEKLRLASFSRRTELGDITNKASRDTSRKEVDGQGRRKDVENISPDQTNVGKGKIEKLREENTRSLERQRILQNKTNGRSADEVSRSLQDNLKHIDQAIRLQELSTFSMTDRSMESRGVDPEKFRQISRELSNALKNSSPDQLRVSATRKEFIEMARKLGLRPEI